MKINYEKTGKMYNFPGFSVKIPYNKHLNPTWIVWKEGMDGKTVSRNVAATILATGRKCVIMQKRFGVKGISIT